VVDEWMTVSDAESFRMARRLTHEEGLFCGGSTGLNVHAALEVARKVDDPEALVVTIQCDTGERYLSKVYDDHWMRENQMMEAERVTAATLLEVRAREIPPLVSVAPAANVRQALNLMGTYSISQIPVIDGADCVGGLTEGALTAKALADSRVLERSVTELMQAPFPVVDAQAPLERLTMILSHETAALVRQHGTLVGILTRSDVLKRVAGIR
jgi:cystathionine beta-synthase